MQPDDKTIVTTSESEALQRLRDRTDELELIISSLTIFALFSLPGWLFHAYTQVYTHISTGLAIAANVGIVLVVGVCYGLATCFVVHLMARAYWVGLIGLRTVFPDGINWNRTPGIGPLTKQHYRKTLPDLDSMIERTDRLASSLFAVISLLTLGMLWFGTVFLIILVIAGLIGAQFGLTNTGMALGGLLMLVIFAGVPVLIWLLDAQLAARFVRLQESGFFIGLIRKLGRVASIAFPRRLVLPVQLTLQSNTRPILFYIALTVGIAAIVVVGNTRFVAWQSFTLSDEFTYLNGEQAADGFRSTYYEDMSSSEDGVRAWPRIDSFQQRGSFVRLFLPYQPLRDNLVLDQLCVSADAAADRADCLRRLWSVSIEGKPVPMKGFATAERMDLRMRGLIGLVPLSDLAPGLRTIEVTWNPSAGEEDVPVDDRYTQVNLNFTIPIAFAPDYELPLQ